MLDKGGATKSVPRPDPAEHDVALVQPRRGMRLGRYELVARVARGGMADVWIGRQLGELGFSRIVAIKTILPELAEEASFRRMFLEEARIASRIRHTHIVEVLDLGEEGSIVFQVMTLVEGDSVAGLLKRIKRRGRKGGLPAHIALRIVSDALAGLHAAHELVDVDGVPLGLVHRDVSPQNILVGSDGVSKLSDFGIAKVLGRHGDETVAGQVKGKLAYLSPEQATRQPLDRRSDVFATGIVLWEALTGERLFRGLDVVETLSNVATKAVPDPRSVDPTIPAPIAEVTKRALEREPGARFATAAEMAEALDAAAHRAGKTASTKEVGALVTELAGADIERVRRAVRRALRGEIVADPPSGIDDLPSEGSVATTHAKTPVPRTGGRLGATLLGVGGVALLAGGAIAIAMTLRPSPQPPTAPAAAEPPAPATVAPPPPIPSGAPSAEVPATAEIAPTAAPAASSAPPRAPPAPLPRGAAPHRPTPTPAPTLRPKFESPYER